MDILEAMRARYSVRQYTTEMKSEEICGYHRERFVLLAQQLDLNFCRTALTCRKSKRTSAVKKVSEQWMRRTREGCA